ncbi:MAG: DNA repair exonuclease [Clostridia bacterium]|nr:DNA repair exonuclease [Clostridia bacterium]
MIKILHCADLHLDSPFSGLDPIQSEKRREEQRELLRNLVCYIRNQHVDLVLVAGDLFDSAFTGSTTVKYTAELFKSAGCPIVISPGNHDPYVKNGIYSSGFSKNVRIFDDERLSFFDFEELGVSVWGYAFTSSSYEKHPLDLEYSVNPDRLNILCAHADIIQSLSKYAPISPGELNASPFDYAAFGHIHNAPDIGNYNGTLAAYSGCAEGRSFDELDFGGAILLEVEGRKITTKKIQLAKRRYMIEKIDVTGAENDENVIEKIRLRIQMRNYHDDTSLRVILQGSVASDYAPNKQVIGKYVEDLYSIDIKDETLPTFDEEILMQDISVRGEFYRTLLKTIREGSEEERKTAILALRLGLSALDDKPIIL